MSEIVKLPELGEGVIEAEILSILVTVGDQIAVGSPVAEVATDKVTTEVFSDVAGQVANIPVVAGETIEVGSALVALNGDGSPDTNGDAPAVPDQAPDVDITSAAPDTSDPTPPGGSERVHRTISPLARALALQTGTDYGDIVGSDADGRIVKRDIERAIEAQRTNGTSAPRQPAIPPAVTPDVAVAAAPSSTAGSQTSEPSQDENTGAGTLLPVTPMRRTIASHMVASRKTSPHAMTFFDIDFSAVMAHRSANKQTFADRGLKLTFTPYLVIAISEALQAYPLVNSRWGDENITLLSDVNIGMAVALDDGLIVPVLKDVPSLNLAGVAKQVAILSERARNGSLTSDDLADGTFTLTNHGVTGGLFGTPIINQPQAGILGFGAIEKRVVPVGPQRDQVGIRPRSYASFAFDHRIFDGAVAEHFMSHIKTTIENWS